jgi:integrase
VKTCFKWLAESGHIATSPFISLKLPAAVSRGDDAYLTEDQVGVILRDAEGDLHEILTFLARTGARPKEARILRARHILGHCAVYSRDESKGGRDQRVIHMDDEVFALIQRLRLKRPTGPLFLNSGQPWKAQSLSEKCERLSRRTGIKFSAYSLRHAFATNALLRGADVVSVATLMGHRGTKTLSAIYAHLERRDDHLQQVLQRVTA